MWSRFLLELVAVILASTKDSQNSKLNANSADSGNRQEARKLNKNEDAK